MKRALVVLVIMGLLLTSCIPEEMMLDPEEGWRPLITRYRTFFIILAASIVYMLALGLTRAIVGADLFDAWVLGLPKLLRFILFIPAIIFLMVVAVYGAFFLLINAPAVGSFVVTQLNPVAAGIVCSLAFVASLVALVVLYKKTRFKGSNPIFAAIVLFLLLLSFGCAILELLLP